jgi:hypothetical protein
VFVEGIVLFTMTDRWAFDVKQKRISGIHSNVWDDGLWQSSPLSLTLMAATSSFEEYMKKSRNRRFEVDAAFEATLRALCGQIAACHTEREEIELTGQLQELIEERIKYLKEKTIHLVKS